MGEESMLIQELRAEIEGLRRDFDELRSVVDRFVRPESGNSSHSKSVHLKVASLEIVGSQAEGEESRFSVRLAVDQLGCGLHFHDSRAGTSQVRAALVASENGYSLALCGSDGIPRAILASREEGGGLSLVDANGDLAAELYGVNAASWLTLNNGGAAQMVAVGSPKGGNVELFNGSETPTVVLPLHTEELFSPE